MSLNFRYLYVYGNPLILSLTILVEGKRLLVNVETIEVEYWTAIDQILTKYGITIGTKLSNTSLMLIKYGSNSVQMLILDDI